MKSSLKALVAGGASVLLATVLAGCLDGGDTVAAEPTPTTLALEKIGGFTPAAAGAHEITAYDPDSRRVFVVNGALGTVDVLDLSDPTAPTLVGTLDVSLWGGGVNSVAVKNGYVALAVAAAVKQHQGTVLFYKASDLSLVSSARVGALPDMLTFTPDGKYVLVANEGEPNDDYSNDPEGSISIIDVGNIMLPSVRTADFLAFNSQEASLKAAGVRIFGPGASVAQDLEPEYIAVSADGATAWVTLQENNALAIVDIATAKVTAIKALGYKDHNVAGAGLDPSDKDGGVNIAPWPVYGMYQPDAIASYTVDGQTYLITANEGDARDYAGFAEESRVKNLTLGAGLDPTLKTDAKLGRLNVTTTLGSADGGATYDALYAFGARSFSIWAADGTQVYDSGDELEQRTKDQTNVNFNAGNDNDELDNRSDNKGPEPEGVVVARFGAKHYAFIGLERVGGVIVYDVSNPLAPSYVTYLNTREGVTGDLGPEGIAFVPASASPNGKPLLIIGNEISGTTAIYQINLL